jgi:hypothetical protein
MTEQLQGPFEKFVDSPYYSEPELCGVTEERWSWATETEV